MTTEATTRTCIAVNYHDDMYPEFAPDPIEVTCRNAATFSLVWLGPKWDEDGYPVPGTLALESEPVCDEHLCEALNAEDDGNPPLGYPGVAERTLRAVRVLG